MASALKISGIRKTYGKKGEEIVLMNLKAVDNTLANLYEVPLANNQVNGTGGFVPAVTPNAPRYVRDVLGKLAAGLGDELPVSAFACDGTFPTASAQYEKRNLALEIPVWDEFGVRQPLRGVPGGGHSERVLHSPGPVTTAAWSGVTIVKGQASKVSSNVLSRR